MRRSAAIPSGRPIPNLTCCAGSAGRAPCDLRPTPSAQILDIVKYLEHAAAMAHRDRAGRIAENRIASVRRFNRFYTRQIGVLRKTFLDSSYSLGEARVLYEIASGHSLTASEIGRALDLDAGYLSRVLRNFEKRGLIERKASASDARQSHLALSPRGRIAYAPLEARSQRDTGAMLGKLTAADQARLIVAMTTIETLLGGAAEENRPAGRDY